MKLGYTILYVEDVAKTLAFYEQAFGLKTAFLSPGAEFGALDTGATALAFCTRKYLRDAGKTVQPPDAQQPCFEIALTTHDVPVALARAVTAGATLTQAAEVMPWGQTVGYVTDLEGFCVEICTPMGGD